MFDSVLTIALGAILINNFIFSQFLGCCPFLGCSTKIDTALGMGLAVTFVMGLASAICYAVNTLLIALDLEYMSTLAFIQVIAVLVQFVEMFLKKSVPSLYTALGIFLPLITTNCAVMGVTILVQREEYDLTTSLLYAVASSLGFMLALILMAGIRERLDTCRVPKALMGTPIALIMAGLMSLAFMAFKGMTS